MYMCMYMCQCVWFPIQSNSKKTHELTGGCKLTDISIQEACSWWVHSALHSQMQIHTMYIHMQVDVIEIETDSG
jgi:hypothetical protein